MGQILSLIQSQQDSVQIFLDFENAKPSAAEKEVYDQVAQVLNKGPAILEKLHSYTGCEEFIRRAITNPSPDSEEEAWNAVLPAVDQLKEFYDFSLELENCFPKLLTALCNDDPKQSLGDQQALAKQLADVFDFVLRFDDLKMVNPAIQNDFSYYRRTLNRMKLSKKDLNISIRDELANRMSLFFAYPTPMMNVINETTVKFLAQDQGVQRDHVTLALSTMANVCEDMVEKKKFENNETNMFCLRCMTGSIILFDHLHTPGAFSKRSPIKIKNCIMVLKNFTGDGGGTVDGLLNALRFTTIHLNDADTPNNIKHLLDQTDATGSFSFSLSLSPFSLSVLSRSFFLMWKDISSRSMSLLSPLPFPSLPFLFVSLFLPNVCCIPLQQTLSHACACGDGTCVAIAAKTQAPLELTALPPPPISFIILLVLLLPPLLLSPPLAFYNSFTPLETTL